MTNRTDDFPWQPRTPEDIRKLVLALQTEAESHPERAFSGMFLALPFLDLWCHFIWVLLKFQPNSKSTAT